MLSTSEMTLSSKYSSAQEEMESLRISSYARKYHKSYANVLALELMKAWTF